MEMPLKRASFRVETFKAFMREIISVVFFFEGFRFLFVFSLVIYHNTNKESNQQKLQRNKIR